MQKIKLLLPAVCFYFLTVESLAAVAAPLDAASFAARLHTRLVGVSPKIGDPMFEEEVSRVRAGDLRGAARIALQDPLFYAVRMRSFSAPYSSRDLSPNEPFNDLQALFVGITRDDLDARQLLTADFRYEASPSLGLSQVSIKDNKHYEEIADRGLDLNRVLVRVDRQWREIPEAAGILTTRAWAKAHYIAGTNRRAVKFALELFACTPLESIRRGGVTDSYVRRDVDRMTGGDPATYQNHCRLCHSPMDGIGGAFARLNFEGSSLTHSGFFEVAAKMNQNSNVYPDGRAVFDDSWINLIVDHPGLDLGWRGATDGRGILAFGRMLADSRAFSRCLVKKVFREVCSRDPKGSESAMVGALTDEFESGGYRLKDLFANVGVREECIGTDSLPSERKRAPHVSQLPSACTVSDDSFSGALSGFSSQGD